MAEGNRPVSRGSRVTKQVTFDYDELNYWPDVRLSLPLQFEAESIKRSIDDADDLDTLKDLARQLADLYIRQRAATAWVIAEK